MVPFMSFQQMLFLPNDFKEERKEIFGFMCLFIIGMLLRDLQTIILRFLWTHLLFMLFFNPPGICKYQPFLYLFYCIYNLPGTFSPGPKWHHANGSCP